MSGGFFMRKIIIPLFLMILLVIGCDNTMNTPTVKVEKFLGKYQKMDYSYASCRQKYLKILQIKWKQVRKFSSDDL